MTLGNMRANGVRSLKVHCWVCGHDAVLNSERWSDDLPLPKFTSRMACTRCGSIGNADLRPNWIERPDRPTLTGVQWR
jgi:hypothetical protein